MKLSKLLALSVSGLLLVSCGDKKKENKTAENTPVEITEVPLAKSDSISYGLGLNFSGQVNMVRRRLSMTDTKLNEKVYLEGFKNEINSKDLKFPSEKQESILLNFSNIEGELFKNKKKSTTLNISEEGTIKTLMDSVSYSLGVKFAGNAKKSVKDLEKDLQLKINTEKLSLGYSEGITANDSTFNSMINIYKKTIMDFRKERIDLIHQGNKLEGEKFLDENKTKEGVKTTASGLQYIVMKEGKGEKPVATSNVKVHYHGTLLDGTVFDSSVDRKQPAEFPLNRVIPGWTEGVQLMTTGSKYKFFIPQTLAYGSQIGPKIKPYSTLIFEVELLEVKAPKQQTTQFDLEKLKQQAAQQAKK